MVIIKPIPRYILCHSAVLTVSFEPDKWGNPVASVSSPLENVRFEPYYRNDISTSKNDVKITARLFIDSVNSSCGLPLMMNVGDTYDGKKISAQTITFSGHDYNIEEIRTLYDDKNIHHYEVMLSG